MRALTVRGQALRGRSFLGQPIASIASFESVPILDPRIDECLAASQSRLAAAGATDANVWGRSVDAARAEPFGSLRRPRMLHSLLGHPEACREPGPGDESAYRKRRRHVETYLADDAAYEGELHAGARRRLGTDDVKKILAERKRRDARAETRLARVYKTERRLIRADAREVDSPLGRETNATTDYVRAFAWSMTYACVTARWSLRALEVLADGTHHCSALTFARVGETGFAARPAPRGLRAEALALLAANAKVCAAMAGSGESRLKLSDEHVLLWTALTANVHFAEVLRAKSVLVPEQETSASFWIECARLHCPAIDRGEYAPSLEQLLRTIRERARWMAPPAAKAFADRWREAVEAAPLLVA